MTSIFKNALLSLLFITATHSYAQGNMPKTNTVVIQDAWARATNPGQEVGAVYMTLTSPRDTTLVSVKSDATESVEIHSMSMQNGIMKMRMLDKLALMAGKPYKLAPGGYHLMLFDLKKPLIAGEQLSLTLHFKDKNNAVFQQQIKVPVKSAKDAEDAADHSHHH